MNVVMPRWDTSCRDWRQRIMSGTSLVREDLPLFQKQVDLALRVFNRLILPDVIGTPTMAVAAGEWFRKIVAALFGSYDVENQRRMIQEFFLLVPKKNGKSSYAAAIMVVALLVNYRPNAEFVLVAPTKEIADIAFRQASGIIKGDEELKKVFWIKAGKKIEHRVTGATLAIKAADTDIITGGKQVGTLIDETHEFAHQSNAADVFLEIRGALAARPDGFLIQITTQSKKRPSGVFLAELKRARAVRDGRLAYPMLPVLYELPPEMEEGAWRLRENWELVNPNLGRSVDPEFLENALNSADQDGPEALALLASQHFNVEIGVGLKTDSWAGAEFWEEAVDATLTLETLLERSEVVTIGIDGGGLDDLFSMCVLGREKVTRRWLCWTKSWAHKSVLARRKSIAPTLLDFQNAKDLTIIETDMEDAFREAAEIAEIVFRAGLLSQVGLDPAGVGSVVDALAKRGIEGEDRIKGIPQGWPLNGSIKTAGVKVANGTLVHCGQGIVAWAVGNAKAEMKGNAVTINKQAAGTAKIDPLMAIFDAVALMSRNPEAQGPSVFDLLGAKGAKAVAKSSQSDVIDPAILADPMHPQWQAMKERWERRHLPDDGDDF